jgi:hypothetical protein
MNVKSDKLQPSLNSEYFAHTAAGMKPVEL